MKHLTKTLAVAVAGISLMSAPAFAAHHEEEKMEKKDAVKVEPGKESIELDETQKADQEPTKHMEEVVDENKDTNKDEEMTDKEADGDEATEAAEPAENEEAADDEEAAEKQDKESSN